METTETVDNLRRQLAESEARRRHAESDHERHLTAQVNAEARADALEDEVAQLRELYTLVDRLDDCLLEFGLATDGVAACSEHLDAVEKLLYAINKREAEAERAKGG